MAELFDFSAMMGDLAAHEVVAENRRKTQLTENAEQQGIRQKSADLSADYAKNVDFLRQSVATSSAKAADARRLADSNNPLDTLRLMGLQMLDPAGYDRRVRTARLAEDSQRAAVIGQITSIDQGALEAQLLLSQGRVQEAQLLENISMERLKTLQDQAAMARGNAEAAQTMKTLAIQGLDTTQLTAAIGQAQLNPEKKTNIAGVDLDMETLQRRLADQQEIEHQRKLRGFLRQTEEFTATEAVKDIPATAQVNEANRKIATANAENADTEILLRKSQLQTQVRQYYEDSQNRELGHMTVEQLQAIRTANYTDATGERFTPAAVDEAYTRANQARSDGITQELQKQLLNGYDTDKIVTESNRVKTLMSRYKANSQLYNAANGYLQTLSYASLGVGADKPVGVRITAVQAMDQAAEAFGKAVDAEAKKLYPKDSDMQAIVSEFYRGNTIPTENLMNAVQSRLKTGKSVADVFPPDMAVKVSKYYSQFYQDSKRAGLADPAFDDALARQEAAQQAVDLAIQQEVATHADQVLIGQVMYPGHPLASLGPAGFGSLIANADNMAFSMWMDEFSLSQEDAMTIKQGGQIESISPEENQRYAGALRELENIQLLQQLEAQGVGMGSELVRWWQEKGTEYLDAQTFGARKGPTVNDSIVNELSGDYTKKRMLQYGMELYQADGNIKSNQARMLTDLVTFGNDPAQMQVTLLDADKTLSSPEKRRVYSEVIQPLIDEAKRGNLSFEDATNFIEQGILNFQGNDPQMKNILKNLRRTRPEIAETLSTFRRQARWFNAETMGSSVWRKAMLSTERPSAGYLDWYPGNQRRMHQGDLAVSPEGRR